MAETRRRMLSAVAAALVIVLALSLLSSIERTQPDLSQAVADGDYPLVRALVDQGVDPDDPVINGLTPLMRAAIRDHGRIARLLLDAGADLEAAAPAGGLTALHAAAIADSVDALNVLIEEGADLAKRSLSGRNALDHAAAAGSVRAIEALTAAGMDPNARSEAIVQIPGYPSDVGPTPIAIAARAGSVDAVEALLDLGADVDGRSERGQTALLQAVASGQAAEMIALLLDGGADARLRSVCAGSCPASDTDVLGWAHRLGDPAIVELIEDHTGIEQAAGKQRS